MRAACNMPSTSPATSAIRGRRNACRSARIQSAVKSSTCIGISEYASRENDTSGSTNAKLTTAASATYGLRRSRQAATKKASSATPPMQRGRREHEAVATEILRLGEQRRQKVRELEAQRRRGWSGTSRTSRT